MKVLYGKRGSGKTTELVKTSAETGYYLIVKDRKMAAFCLDIARKLDLHIPYPLTYKEFLDHEYFGQRIKGFLMDDADLFIQHLTEVRVYGVTVSEEDYFHGENEAKGAGEPKRQSNGIMGLGGGGGSSDE